MLLDSQRNDKPCERAEGGVDVALRCVLLLNVAALLLVFHLNFGISRVAGDSMQPQIGDGAILL